MNIKSKTFKIILILFLISLFSFNIFSENIYFYGKTAFKNPQFWEKQYNKFDKNDLWKVYSNFFGGSIGAGIEMVIWDMGVKRGSRLFFKGGMDFDMFGLNFIGAYKDGTSTLFNYEQNKLYGLTDDVSIFYLGFDLDLFVGGTFPRTNLIWGFGASWNFLFPAYSNAYDVRTFNEKFAFFAVPSIILGYDVFIPNSNIKITPQLRAGFTCNPLIPDDVIKTAKSEEKEAEYYTLEKYSGVYLELSVAVSFYSIQWKK